MLCGAQVSMNALDPMMRRLLEELELLANDADADINMTSPRFDFIWKVAYHQLLDGLWQSNDYYSGGCGRMSVWGLGGVWRAGVLMASWVNAAGVELVFCSARCFLLKVHVGG